MRQYFWCCLVFLVDGSVVHRRRGVANDQRSVRAYLASIESTILQRTYDETSASWDYESNITDYTGELSMKVALDNAVFWKVLNCAAK